MRIISFLLALMFLLPSTWAANTRRHAGNDHSLELEIRHFKEFQNKVYHNCVQSPQRATYRVTVNGQSLNCGNLLRAEETIKQNIEKKVAAFERSCEAPTGNEGLNGQIADHVRVARAAGSCPRQPSDDSCAVQAACAMASAAIPIIGALAQAVTSLGSRNTCANSGSSCMDSLYSGIMRDLWGTLTSLWGGAVWVVGKIGEGISYVGRSALERLGVIRQHEAATSVKAMAAQQQSKGFIQQFRENPLKAIKDLGVTIYKGLTKAAQETYGCEQWQLPNGQLVSDTSAMFKKDATCKKPMENWDCASCAKKIKVFCGVAGMAEGEIIQFLLTGGLIGGAKVLAAKIVQGAQNGSRLAHAAVAAGTGIKATLSVIPKVAGGIVTATGFVLRTVGVAHVATAAEKAAIAAWRAAKASPLAADLGRAAANSPRVTAGAKAVASVVGTVVNPVTYLHAMEAITNLGEHTVVSGLSRAGVTEASEVLTELDRVAAARNLARTPASSNSVAHPGAASSDTGLIVSSGAETSAPSSANVLPVTTRTESPVATIADRATPSASGVPLTVRRTEAATSGGATIERASASFLSATDREAARSSLAKKGITPANYADFGFDPKVAANLSDDERVFLFEKISGIENLSKADADKLIAAHNAGAGFGSYTIPELRSKATEVRGILVSNGVTDPERISEIINSTIRQGILGRAVPVAERPGLFARVKSAFGGGTREAGSPGVLRLSGTLPEDIREAQAINVSDSFGAANKFTGNLDELIRSNAFREQGPYGQANRNLWWEERTIDGEKSLAPIRQDLCGKGVRGRRQIYWPKDQVVGASVTSYVTNFARFSLGVNQCFENGAWVDHSLEGIVRNPRTNKPMPVIYEKRGGQWVAASEFEGKPLPDACIKCHQSGMNPGVMTAYPHKAVPDPSKLDPEYLRVNAQGTASADGIPIVDPIAKRSKFTEGSPLPSRSELIAEANDRYKQTARIGRYDAERRVDAAETVLGYRFDGTASGRAKKSALTSVGEDLGGQLPTPQKIEAAYRRLEQAGFTPKEAESLIVSGTAGSPPIGTNPENLLRPAPTPVAPVAPAPIANSAPVLRTTRARGPIPTETRTPTPLLAQAELEAKITPEMRRNSQLNSAGKRVQAAGDLFDRGLTAAEAKALEEAHLVGAGTGRGYFTYTPEEIIRKGLILREAGFTAPEIRALLDSGIAGDLPAGVRAAGTTDARLVTEPLDRSDAISATNAANKEFDVLENRLRKIRPEALATMSEADQIAARAAVRESRDVIKARYLQAGEGFANSGSELIREGNTGLGLQNVSNSITAYTRAGSPEKALTEIRFGISKGMTPQGVIDGIQVRKAEFDRALLAKPNDPILLAQQRTAAQIISDLRTEFKIPDPATRVAPTVARPATAVKPPDATTAASNPSLQVSRSPASPPQVAQPVPVVEPVASTPVVDAPLVPEVPAPPTPFRAPDGTPRNRILDEATNYRLGINGKAKDPTKAAGLFYQAERESIRTEAIREIRSGTGETKFFDNKLYDAFSMSMEGDGTVARAIIDDVFKAGGETKGNHLVNLMINEIEQRQLSTYKTVEARKNMMALGRYVQDTYGSGFYTQAQVVRRWITHNDW
jgi:hypothetical protein